jgi:hypothetical protein
MVPGNHDCDFDKERDLRRRLLETDDLATWQEIRDTSLVEELTSVQQEYFNLMQRLSPKRESKHPFDNIAWTFELSLSRYTVLFRGYNTAWMSRIRERQGQLSFPLVAIPPDDKDGDLIISLLHHPYNWLEASQARMFRHRIEDTSDIILTGHEHEAEVRTHSNQERQLTHYVEQDVLQDHSSSRSGFNVVLIDLDSQSWRVITFSWKPAEELFAPSFEGSWNALGRTKRARRNFVNTEDFAAALSDLGANFTHPRVRKLSLKDLFVYPDVDVGLPAKQNTVTEFISGEKLLEFVLREKRCIFLGPTRVGKTALAKILYGAIQDSGKIPLFLRGSSIRPQDTKDLTGLINQAVVAQYGSDQAERFLQLPTEAKAIVLDDLHQAPLNANARAALLRGLRGMFEVLVLFVDHEITLDTTLSGENLEMLIEEFRFCRIREFGHLRRELLIKKWCALGDPVSEEDERAYQIADIEKNINTLLGKRLLPSFPVFVFTLLQILESGRSPKTIAGSYGYVYETLIAMALARAGGSETIDTKFAYLGCIAYRMFSTKQYRLSVDAIEEVAEEYFKRYRVKISQDKMSRELHDSYILSTDDSGVSFKYSYLYYFFVAKYFQENITAADEKEILALRLELGDLARNLFNDDAANILIFYVYLTKDPTLIREVIEQAKLIFGEEPLCYFQSDVAFINGPDAELKVVYSEDEKASAREKHLRALDRADELEKGNSEGRDVSAAAKQGVVGNVNAAVRTIQVIGQILRNFPGSLRGEVKLNMAAETYRLGLRTLHVVLRDIALAFERARADLSKSTSGPFAQIPEEERERRINRMGFFLTLMCGYGTVKIVSEAVGSAQLKETYREIIESDDQIGFRFIDLAVRLDHLRPFPEDQLFDAFKKVTGNPFGQVLVRMLALQFMYLYPTKPSLIQKICSRLGLDMKGHNTKYLDPNLKLTHR